MADRSVSVVLKANVAGYVAGIKQAEKSTRDFAGTAAESAKRHRADWDAVGKGMMLTGAAVGLAVGAAVKSNMNFEKSMSAVQAATRETAGTMDRLRQAALDAGARTKFSATEAANGIEELAKAGVGTADILAGGLAGALDLAAAGGQSVAEAAETAASTMTQFGLAGEDVTHIADVLAATAGKAQGSVSDVALAMEYVGPVAAQMGVSMEEAAGAVGLLASNGVLGEKAGTGLRGILMSLTSPSKAAADEMRNLGLNMYDANGQFVGLDGVAGQLQESMSGLTAAERDQAFGRIFGNEQITAARILYKAGEEDLRKWTSAVDDEGYAAETAAIKMDNLAGDLEQLRGSIETALIQSGSAGNDALRDMAQGATGAVNAFSELPAPLQEAVVKGGALVAVVGLVGGAFVTMVPKVVAAKGALETLGLTGQRTTGILETLGKTAGVLAVGQGLNLLVTATQGAVAGLEETTEAALKAETSLAAVNDLFRGKGVGDFKGDIDGVADAMNRLADPNIVTRLNDISGEILSFGSAEGSAGRERLIRQFEQVGNALGQLVASGHAEQAAAAFNAMAEEVKKAGFSADQLRELMPGYTEALAGARNEQDLAKKSANGMAGSLGTVEDQLTATEKAQKELTDALNAGNNQFLNTRSAARQYRDTLDAVKESVRENGKTTNITTAAGRANQAALDAQADSALALLGRIEAQEGPSRNFQKALRQTRADLINAAKSMGMSEEAARDYAAQILAVPAAKATAITTPGLSAARSGIQGLDKDIDNVNSKTVTLRVMGDGIIKKVINGQIQGGHYADGGEIKAARGGPREDNVPIWASRGEYVVNAHQTAKHRPLLDAINSGRSFAGGGYVTVDTSAEMAPTGTASRAIAKAEATVVDSLSKSVKNLLAKSAAMLGGTTGGAGMGYQRQMSLLRSRFPGLTLISGFRPGAITATGNRSYHSMGRAVDIPPSMAVFDWIRANYGRGTRELIFSPAGGRQIHNGRPHVYTGITRAMHWDHVHWAMDKGGVFPNGTTAVNTSGKPEVVFSNPQWQVLRRFADPAMLARAAATHTTAAPASPGVSLSIGNVTAADPSAAVDVLMRRQRQALALAGI